MSETVMSKRFYQRTIPMIVVSALIGLLLLEFISVENVVLDTLKSELSVWGIIATTVVLLYTQILFTGSRVRALIKPNNTPRQTLQGLAFVGTLVIFFGVAAVEGDWGGGQTYTYMYLGIIGVIGVGISSLRFWAHAFTAYRVICQINSVEAILYAVAWLASFLKSMTIAMFYLPQIGDVADFIMLVPYQAVSRVSLAAVGVSTVLLALRALIGREPGVIETEVEA